jgi:RNA-directed DNA polymerase
MGKDLTELRSPQRKLMPDIAGSEHHKQTSLRGIATKARRSRKHRFRNLYGCLNKDFLLLAFKSLNAKAASGVDEVTVEAYKENLYANIDNLALSLKEKKYKAKLVRRKYIPKDNGKSRPLGIPALEDKIVQSASAMLLNAIFEQDFVEASYGYRPGRSAKEATADLCFQLQFGRYGYVVEADIKGFFDNIDHDWLLTMLAVRVDDKAFLRLIEKWLKAGILEPDGHVMHPDTGTPQGGIISPILANIYLHYALDLWFEKVVKKHIKGKALIMRYADDWVCGFQFKDDARKFYEVLPKRLKKFSLEVEPTKTQTLRFSRFHPGMKRRFTFLGFEFCWMKDRTGIPRVKRRTSRKKLWLAVRRLKEWIKMNRHKPMKNFFRTMNSKLKGHYNYYGVRGNSNSIWRFYKQAVKLIYKWLNRRSQRKSLNWDRYGNILKGMNIARPVITERKRLHRVSH